MLEPFKLGELLQGLEKSRENVGIQMIAPWLITPSSVAGVQLVEGISGI